jgi:hypothetical protein
MAIEPNVKPDKPNLLYVELLAAAREEVAALRNAFRRVFRLIRNPPHRKMLQTRNDRLRHLDGAACYMETVWNPLNIVSDVPGHRDESEASASNDSAVIYP